MEHLYTHLTVDTTALYVIVSMQMEGFPLFRESPPVERRPETFVSTLPEPIC